MDVRLSTLLPNVALEEPSVPLALSHPANGRLLLPEVLLHKESELVLGVAAVHGSSISRSGIQVIGPLSRRMRTLSRSKTLMKVSKNIPVPLSQPTPQSSELRLEIAYPEEPSRLKPGIPDSVVEGVVANPPVLEPKRRAAAGARKSAPDEKGGEECLEVSNSRLPNLRLLGQE
ncbi:lysozyme [Striga asiatica]|uniref:Lysozyme n=1 Tax=Striga asiatica TaxID=4170 RepID=A0A5A7QC57_STRAF|nr:lysozyme [Striga asiatica]